MIITQNSLLPLSRVILKEVVQFTKRVVTNEMNKNLIGNFSKDEVTIVLKQLDPLKAPRPDGMPPIFFQYYWKSIGDDVATTVLSCLNSGKLAPKFKSHFH